MPSTRIKTVQKVNKNLASRNAYANTQDGNHESVVGGRASHESKQYHP